MIGASGIQMVECSYCSGSLVFLAYCAKSEQAHHCAGMESLSYPVLNVLVQSTAWSFVLCPAGVEVTGRIFLSIHRWQREACSGFLTSETATSRHRCGLRVVGWETLCYSACLHVGRPNFHSSIPQKKKEIPYIPCLHIHSSTISPLPLPLPFEKGTHVVQAGLELLFLMFSLPKSSLPTFSVTSIMTRSVFKLLENHNFS